MSLSYEQLQHEQVKIHCEISGLPVQFVTVFYIFFAIWWIIILLWVAYKLDLWPDSLNPVHVDIEVDEEIEIDGAEVPKTAVKYILCFLDLLNYNVLKGKL